MNSQKPKVAPLDPIVRVPQTALENIFIHLRPLEVKINSLVSSKWNSAIKASPACCKKLKLVIDNENDDWTWKCFKETKAIVRKRVFSNVFITNATNISDDLPKLMALHCIWKNVTIFSTEFSTTSKYVEFIETFRKTVENLNILYVTIKRNENVGTILEFPRLTNAQIKSSSDFVYHCRCPVLEKLEISGASVNLGTIPRMMMSMKKLTWLCLHRAEGKWLDKIFRSEVNYEYPFHLEKISISYVNFGDNQPQLEHLKRFLKSQSSSIRSLHFGYKQLPDREMWEIFFGMKLLKFLAMAFCPIQKSYTLILS